MNTAPIADAADREFRRQFAEDVHYYLSQRPRQLPSRYLYDALGSALFNAICELPWYRVTRAEAQLITAHAPGVFAALPRLGRIVELGAGNGVKLRRLLGAREGATPLHVELVDVSRAALDAAARELRGLPGVAVTGHHATYEAGMELAARSATASAPTLVLFLGSNIGNFDPPSADALLRHVRVCLRAGDALLLGADLVKPEADLLLAYDDPLGVTAAFNRNLLVRANRELGAAFDLDAFAHRAVWNGAERRVEMHLVSARDQRIVIPGADVDITMAAGETIWTESSYKYEPREVVRTIERAGFAAVAQWVDEAAGFALTLCRVA